MPVDRLRSRIDAPSNPFRANTSAARSRMSCSFRSDLCWGNGRAADTQNSRSTGFQPVLPSVPWNRLLTCPLPSVPSVGKAAPGGAHASPARSNVRSKITIRCVPRTVNGRGLSDNCSGAVTHNFPQRRFWPTTLQNPLPRKRSNRRISTPL